MCCPMFILKANVSLWSEMTFTQWQDFIDTERSSDNGSNCEMDIDNPFLQPPVGEEGAHHSNAGEDREVMTEMRDAIHKKVQQ
jgi:hypothetical protein